MYPQEKSPLDFLNSRKSPLPSKNICFELSNFLEVAKTANFFLKFSLHDLMVNFDTLNQLHTMDMVTLLC